jgi:hypothetical protein
MPHIPSIPPEPTRYDAAYLAAEIEELRALAERLGLGTLEYLLMTAGLEAKRLTHEERRDRAEGKVNPKDLWRPEKP